MDKVFCTPIIFVDATDHLGDATGHLNDATDHLNATDHFDDATGHLGDATDQYWDVIGFSMMS